MKLCMILCLGLMGCMGASSPVKIQKNKNYTLYLPGPPWHRVPDAQTKLDADHAFIKPSSGSTMYVRSECNLYKDASLNQLSMGLRRLFQDVSVLEKKEQQLAKRAALSTIFMGKLDGVKVKVNTVVLKKNSCYFDFVFVALPKSFVRDTPAFSKFVKTFSL